MHDGRRPAVQTSFPAGPAIITHSDVGRMHILPGFPMLLVHEEDGEAIRLQACCAGFRCLSIRRALEEINGHEKRQLGVVFELRWKIQGCGWC